LIHAGYNLDKDFAADPETFFERLSDSVGIDLHRYSSYDFPRGGIIGQVTLADCVTTSRSPWYTGEYGFVLQDPCALPFLKLPGKPGFFEVEIRGA